MRDGFVFYRSFYEALKDLPRDIQGEVFTAIMEYGLNGITTDNLKPVARSIFILMKPLIDKNNQRYENGKKGGRPPKTKTKQKPNGNQTETKQEPEEEDKEEVSTNVDIKEENTKKKKFNFKKSLLGYGFEESWVDEWMKVRKSKGAVNSEKAFENFIREVEKTDMDKNELLELIAVKKQWRGFEAKWIENENNKTHAENRGNSQVTDEQLAESIRRGIARGVAENAR